ncbi:hypothetical protein [Saccharolobus shibatae]|nr:hypothetical protein [Saccharolobus shibatae]
MMILKDIPTTNVPTPRYKKILTKYASFLPIIAEKLENRKVKK